MMDTQLKMYRKKLIVVLMLLAGTIKLYANVNAIDLKKINYPAALQSQVDYLINNQHLYNHWEHTWKKENEPKTDVVKKLIVLYTELKKLPSGNLETELLLGDISHYLYNMETEEYYQKAIDHYTSAQQLAPKDYRVYWFLGNHYALSAVALKASEYYQKAMVYLPQPNAHSLFWADYAVACSTANMPATALYAAEKSSAIEGRTSYIENELGMFKKGILHSPPTDTVISARDLWFGTRVPGGQIDVVNWAAGMKLNIDSTWQIQPNDYNKGTTYVTIKPPTIKTQNGRTVGYTIMVFARTAKKDESLKQYMDLFTGKYQNRKATTMNVGQIENCMAYEIKDPSVYTNVGGGHMYAIVLEREKPDYPGMLLEQPNEIPKTGEKGPAYYMSARKFSRVNGKIYYLILLDSCEDIHAQSLASFNTFLNKGLTIE